jgi:uncharacterized membrane protein YgcG
MEKYDTIRPSEQARRKRHQHKRVEVAAVGAVVLGLAVIGLCVIIVFAGGSTVKYIKDFIGPDETPKFFQAYIAPVVMQDPPPFTDIKKASPVLLLKTAIWATLSEDANQGKYATTDDGHEIVPISDITVDFVKFFGDEISPKYQTFSDNGANYEYDAKAKCYYIPQIAVDNFFTPVIQSITPKNGIVKLSVGYVPGTGWGQNPDGTASAPAATKTMVYTLKGSRGKYIIIAINNAPAQADNNSKSNSSSGSASSSSTSSGSASSGSVSSGSASSGASSNAGSSSVSSSATKTS